jgi:predicted GTPase
VRAFTATQIPFIDQRTFPRALAGPGYDDDIPIFDESELPKLIERFDIDFVFFAYSDIPHAELMHKASLVQAAGASFVMLGPDHTQLASMRPVVSVTATRTGAGKSPLTQWLARLLTDTGKRVAVIRHPMPYGNLDLQRVQRFATPADLDEQQCTIEEREEYEPYVDMGIPIYAGVDYQGILDQASADADIVLWDGGNNDFSFIRPDLDIVVVDALRAGHEIDYFPGEVNFRRADVLVISKCGAAAPGDVAGIRERAARLNPEAAICTADLSIEVADAEQLEGKRVLVIEDGPTLTHGEMAYGAGWVAARRFGAAEIVDPRPYAVGSIRETYRKYPNTGAVLPAMGYGDQMVHELEQTINNAQVDLVLIGTPIDLASLLRIDKPSQRVRYELQEIGQPTLEDILKLQFGK